MSVYYQTYAGRDGTLWFDFDPNISIQSLDLTYTELNRTVVINTNTSVTVQGLGITQSKALGIEG